MGRREGQDHPLHRCADGDRRIFPVVRAGLHASSVLAMAFRYRNSGCKKQRAEKSPPALNILGNVAVGIASEGDGKRNVQKQ